jgi:hypothetical protein
MLNLESTIWAVQIQIPPSQSEKYEFIFASEHENIARCVGDFIKGFIHEFSGGISIKSEMWEVELYDDDKHKNFRIDTAIHSVSNEFKPIHRARIIDWLSSKKKAIEGNASFFPERFENRTGSLLCYAISNRSDAQDILSVCTHAETAQAVHSFVMSIGKGEIYDLERRPSERLSIQSSAQRWYIPIHPKLTLPLVKKYNLEECTRILEVFNMTYLPDQELGENPIEQELERHTKKTKTTTEE